MMQLGILAMTLFFTFASGERGWAGEQPVILRGHLPARSYPEMESWVASIWSFVRRNTGNRLGRVESPILYFSPFSFTKQEPSWTQFQRDWIEDHPEIQAEWNKYAAFMSKSGRTPKAQEAGNPFPPSPHFPSFFYTGTNRIQLDPTIKAVFKVEIDPTGAGALRDFVGYGYYMIGHELHHYALEQLGIPVALHHCLFLQERSGDRPSLMKALAEELVNKKMAFSMIEMRALSPELQMQPCEKLSAQDRANVAELAGNL